MSQSLIMEGSRVVVTSWGGAVYMHTKIGE